MLTATTFPAHYLFASVCLFVQEHAYYIDFANRRPDFLENFFSLINWDKVSERFAAAA